MISDQSDSDAEVDFRETPLIPRGKRRPVQLRFLINMATLLVVMSVLAATAPWWVKVTHNRWQQLFPPPPYTGSLLFEDNGVTLTARATTDGHVIWHVGGIQPNSVFFRDGSILYVIPAGEQRLVALRVSDGQQLWTQPIPPAIVFTVVGSYQGQIYLATRGNEAATSYLVSFAQQTGKPESTVANISAATLDATTHMLSYCQEFGNGHRVTLMNLAIQQPLWQEDFPGINCQIAQRGNLIIDDAVVPSQQLTHFVALDRQTGDIVWQANAGGYPTYFGPTAIIAESDPIGDPTTFDTFTAIDIISGTQLWSHTLQGTNISVFFASISANVGTIDLNTTTTTMLVATAERTGTRLWTLSTVAQAADPRSWRADLNTTTLYFADHAQLRALDLTTGKLLWDITGLAGVPTSLNSQGQTLYEIAGGQLRARDEQTGKVRWQQSISAGAQLCEQCNGTSGS